MTRPAVRGLRHAGTHTFFLLAAHGLSSTDASAQTLGQAPQTNVSILGVVSALILCLVVALAAALLLKARAGRGKPSFGSLLKGARRPGSRLQVVETARVGPNTNLTIVACDGMEYLIASNNDTITLIDKLPAKTGDLVTMAQEAQR